MKNDEFEYIDETKKKSKKPFFLIVLAIIIILFGSLTFITFKTGKIFGIKIPWIKTKEDKEVERYEKELEDQYKHYDRESNLIVPGISEVEYYKVYNDKIKAKANNFSASKEGYKIDLTIINDTIEQVEYKCTKVLIDGFETDTSFELTLQGGSSQDVEATIKKSELDALEINDLNHLTFLGNATLKEGEETINVKTSFTINFIQLTSVNNSKKNLAVLDQKSDFTISYYKTITDNDYNYIYFDIKNTSSSTNFNITINKLFINDSLYDLEDFQTSSHYRSEKIFTVEIPKKDFKQIDKLTISYTFTNDSALGGKNIYITPQMTVNLS